MSAITKSLKYIKLHFDDVKSTAPYDVFKFLSNCEELFDFIVPETNKVCQFQWWTICYTIRRN